MIFVTLVSSLLLLAANGFPSSNSHSRSDVLFFKISTANPRHPGPSDSRPHVQVVQSSVSKLPSLSASSSDAIGDAIDGNDASKRETQLSRLQYAYRFLGYGYFAMALGHLLFFFVKNSSRNTPTITGGIAGYLVAGYLCNTILSENSSSSSDTYQRLNTFGLGLFSALQLPAIYTSPTATVLATILRLAGVAVAVWRRILVPTPLPSLRAVLSSWRVQYRKRALTYRNCCLLLLAGMGSTFLQGVFDVKFRDIFFKSWTQIAPQWEGAARLSLMATMAYTLKDAAERQRLSGTTFIRLNCMVGFWAAAVALGQAANPLSYSHRGRELLALAGPFLLGAYKGRRAKKASMVVSLPPSIAAVEDPLNKDSEQPPEEG